MSDRELGALVWAQSLKMGNTLFKYVKVGDPFQLKEGRGLRLVHQDLGALVQGCQRQKQVHDRPEHGGLRQEREMMSEYLSCAETAKLIRAALKNAFPGVKFSVRSKVYSGGASINVGWTDGPSAKAVKAVAGAYAGGGFDGMIDMAFSVEAWLLPDGSATFASSPGTSGSMGVYAPYDHAAPAPGAKKVRFGADYVFCDKEYSLATYTAAAMKVCAEYGVELPEIKTSTCGGSPWIGGYTFVPNADTDLGTLIHRELQKENHA